MNFLTAIIEIQVNILKLFLLSSPVFVVLPLLLHEDEFRIEQPSAALWRMVALEHQRKGAAATISSQQLEAGGATTTTMGCDNLLCAPNEIFQRK